MNAFSHPLTWVVAALAASAVVGILVWLVLANKRKARLALVVSPPCACYPARRSDTRPTLVVIDMQPKWSPISDGIIGPVAKQIRLAIRRQWNIVLVEFVDNGETFPLLRGLLTRIRYPRFQSVSKGQRDGSTEIISCCQRHGFQLDQIRVCGVYADQCVAETVQGFAARLPHARIEVIEKACAPWDASFQWVNFPKAKNIVLLPTAKRLCKAHAPKTSTDEERRS